MSTDAAVNKGNGLDTDFDPIYDGFADAPIIEAREDVDALPAGVYVVTFDGFKGSFTKDEKIPQVRGGATVVEGVEGTARRKAFGGLKYAVSKYDYRDPGTGTRVKTEMDRSEILEAGRKHQLTLKRVATVLGLLQPLPNRPHTEASLTEFGAQFAGKTVVIRIGQLPGRDGGDPSNFFDWGTIRMLDEQMVDKKGVSQGTALEYAKRKIAAANQKEANRTAARSTASATPTANPGDFS